MIFRKLSFGTESPTGSPTLCVIHSVVETHRRLGRQALTFLQASVQALTLIPTG